MEVLSRPGERALSRLDDPADHPFPRELDPETEQPPENLDDGLAYALQEDSMSASIPGDRLPSPPPRGEDPLDISAKLPSTEATTAVLSDAREPVQDVGDVGTVGGTNTNTADGAFPISTVELSTTSNTKSRSRSSTKNSSSQDGRHVRRLSASKIQELTAAPESLPVATLPERLPSHYPLSAGAVEPSHRRSMTEALHSEAGQSVEGEISDLRSDGTNPRVLHPGRPNVSARTLSTPPTSRNQASGPALSHVSQPASTRRNSFHPTPRPAPLDLDGRSNFVTPIPKVTGASRQDPVEPSLPSPVPTTIPLPPMSIPTVLQLELAGHRPSPLYIHHSYVNEAPYESSAIKFERLKNFLLLPSYLETTMYFGALACLDAWLWTFTVLPIRFWIAVGVLARWWAYLVSKEVRWLLGFVWYGLGRMWQRGRRGRPLSRSTSYDSNTSASAGETSRSRSRPGDVPSSALASGRFPVLNGSDQSQPVRRGDISRLASNGGVAGPVKKSGQQRSNVGAQRHRRTNSMPSNLTSFHKADLLQGAVIICSSIALMNLDASRMYHFVRAQSTMKLYVIYNVLEVLDRLLSALGQDVFECLFSSETLSRNKSGRSKVLLPFGMFLLTLIYNVAHSVTLFYMVITLNVAVNSYSDALLTLLLSNQFVEIKASVFKRIEKDNLFQLTCADIVERFQLWIMLLIIGMRNVVEVGALSIPGAGSELDGGEMPMAVPLHPASALPNSFTILPSWFLSGEVLSPFFVVIGSEMAVDWIKHAYINKFNNIRPNFYARILDILCKDYYTNAYVTPSLTRRLGLPLVPLSCLFIRASVQTYHMFLATHLPPPIPPSTQTSLSVESAIPSSSSPAMVAALDRLDNVIRNALGRAVYGSPLTADAKMGGAAGDPGVGIIGRLWRTWTSDDVIAAVTMVVVFLLVFLVLLVIKLLLGMLLLRYSRNRYAKMKAKEAAVASGNAERESYDIKSKQRGSFGKVEVGDDRKRWVYADDPVGFKKAKEREKRDEKGDSGKDVDYGHVNRYEMIAKRIW